VTVLLVVSLLAAPAAAQGVDSGAVWRTFAEQVDVGATLKVRLRDGQTFRATLVQARGDALLLQPRTRVPVPVQPVPYDAIVSLERDGKGGGVSAGKAAAIGVATGVGGFLATLAILMAAFND
jgi:hypothetical protein